MVGVVPDCQHRPDGDLPCPTIYRKPAMQVNYTDLMWEADNQGLAPEDIEGDYYEVFAKWAGFKHVQDMYDWKMLACYNLGTLDTVQYPYQPTMVPEFNWEPLCQRAKEEDVDYLNF